MVVVGCAGWSRWWMCSQRECGPQGVVVWVTVGWAVWCTGRGCSRPECCPHGVVVAVVVMAGCAVLSTW